MWCWPIYEGACLACLCLGAATVAEFGPQGQELDLWWLFWRHKPTRVKRRKIQLDYLIQKLELHIVISYLSMTAQKC